MADLRTRLIARAGGGLLSGMLDTCRVSQQGTRNFQQFREAGKPVVFVLWHGRLLPCTYWNGWQRLVTLVSQHRDGEYIARIVERWGYTTVRGSSSRRAAGALRELVRHVRAGRSLAVTPDGPRGPREVMKPGALLAAQLTGAPIIPASGGASRGWWFGSWDRFLVPKPFSRVRAGVRRADLRAPRRGRGGAGGGVGEGGGEPPGADAPGGRRGRVGSGLMAPASVRVRGGPPPPAPPPQGGRGERQPRVRKGAA